MLDYHDAKICRMAITMTPGNWDVALDLLVQGRDVKVTFEAIWWVGVHGLGMVANEEQIYSIMETSWDEVPANCRYEAGGNKTFEIQCSSGSKILVVAGKLIESVIP